MHKNSLLRQFRKFIRNSKRWNLHQDCNPICTGKTLRPVTSFLDKKEECLRFTVLWHLRIQQCFWWQGEPTNFRPFVWIPIFPTGADCKSWPKRGFNGIDCKNFRCKSPKMAPTLLFERIFEFFGNLYGINAMKAKILLWRVY